MTPSPAHYIIHGVDTQGRMVTDYTEGLVTVPQIAELALENALDGWKAVFVFRSDNEIGADAPTLTEVTPDVANYAFSQWLDQYGMEPAEHTIPEWIDTQLERLCINAEQERRAYIMGERHASFTGLNANDPDGRYVRAA